MTTTLSWRLGDPSTRLRTCLARVNPRLGGLRATEQFAQATPIFEDSSMKDTKNNLTAKGEERERAVLTPPFFRDHTDDRNAESAKVPSRAQGGFVPRGLMAVSRSGYSCSWVGGNDTVSSLCPIPPTTIQNMFTYLKTANASSSSTSRTGR